MVVLAVVQSSPAARVGLTPGDLITHVDGLAVAKASAVHTILSQAVSPKAAAEVKITVNRGYQQEIITLGIPAENTAAPETEK